MLYIYCFLLSYSLFLVLNFSFLSAYLTSVVFYFLIRLIISRCFSIEISTIDSAFNDTGSLNRPFLLGCSIIEGSVPSSFIKNEISSKISISHHYLKLQKILKTRFGIDYWTFSQSFNINDQIEILQDFPSKSDLCDWMSSHASSEMDPLKPKWKLFIVEKLGNDRSAIIVKIHHAYGDGLSILSFFLNMGSAQNVKFVTLPKINKMVFYFLYPYGLIKALIWANQLVNKTKRDRNKFIEKPITGKLRAFSSNGQGLMECKEYAKKNGVSINEVLLSLMIRTFQKYHQKKFKQPLYEFKVFIASSLRAVSKNLECIPMENNSNFVILDKIPTPERDFKGFLQQIHVDAKFLLKASMDFYFRGVSSELSYAVMPKAFNLKVVNQLTRNISCVFTNVPGPLEKITLFGKNVDEMFFFTGGMNEAGLITTILSYGGKFIFSCSADESYGIDVKELVGEFEELFNKELKININV